MSFLAVGANASRSALARAISWSDSSLARGVPTIATATKEIDAAKLAALRERLARIRAPSPPALVVARGVLGCGRPSRLHARRVNRHDLAHHPGHDSLDTLLRQPREPARRALPPRRIRTFRCGGRRPRRVLEGAVRPVAHDRSLHRSRAPRPRCLERGVPPRRRRRRLARKLRGLRSLRRPPRRAGRAARSRARRRRRALGGGTSRSGPPAGPHSRTTRRGVDHASGSRPRSRRPASSTSRSPQG